MTKDEVSKKVFEIVAGQMGVDRDQLTEETKLTDDLSMDSLDSVELIMEFEDIFDLNIPDDRAEALCASSTIGDIISKISEEA